jgi:hypothetical protein
MIRYSNVTRRWLLLLHCFVAQVHVFVL